MIQLPALAEAAQRQGVSLDKRWQERPRRPAPKQTLNALSFLIERLLTSQTLTIASHIHQDILLMALLELLQAEQPSAELPPATPIARTWLIVLSAM